MPLCSKEGSSRPPYGALWEAALDLETESLLAQQPLILRPSWQGRGRLVRPLSRWLGVGRKSGDREWGPKEACRTGEKRLLRELALACVNSEGSMAPASPA